MEEYEKTAVGARIRRFAEKRFGSLKALADRLGMKPQSLNSYVNGRSAPGGAILQRLNELGCDINWLLRGDEAFDRETAPTLKSPSGAESFSTTVADSAGADDAPEFRVRGFIPAGEGDVNLWNDYYRGHRLDYDPDTHFFLVVDEEFGYSMTPMIQPGDMALVSLLEEPRDGDLVAAKWDETKGALKLLSEQANDTENVVLTSYNQAVPPIFLKRRDVALYKVVLIEKRKRSAPFRYR
jgi:phage repressor protein C with HTH and peptisase S24 domain